MGSSPSKFRKHLQNGDEYAAMQLFTSNSDLHKGLDPNSSYGDNHYHNTPMHYVARHAMKSLLRIFLVELGGNPNKKNSHNETVLHCLCAIEKGLTVVQQQKRIECLILILQWSGPMMYDGRVEKANLSATDEKDNTALHYAATSGIQRIVELLVNHGAPLFVENQLKETPCDCAERMGHSEIALYLESKMVFSNDDQNNEDMDLMNQADTDEGYSGLRAQDLQEAKDQLLVETSDMLRVPLFTAEALLRNHEWSREMLLESWIKDPIACCEKCGVTPPVTLYADHGFSAGPSTASEDLDLRSPTLAISPPAPDTMCEICTCLIPQSEHPVPMSCEHQFCRHCWEIYLSGKIIEGEAHNITCPGYQCNKLVPVDIIETLVSRDMARRYLQFDIKAFVESNPSIKWCPHPGCGRAVRLPEAEVTLSPMFRASASVHSPSDTSRAVDCGNGHTFCWECLGDAHEPASCENWKNWYQKIAEVKPEEMNGTDEETENSANCLWLVTNSKPCSNCKSPIQKNEGCNHMKCSKCKHDFCWVCLEPWKKHSTATGGYFRCNRYEVVKKVEEHQDNLKAEAEVRNKKMQELNRFVHYYSRFKNHENSYKLEEPLFNTAKEKMMILARAVITDHDTDANMETKFVQDAVIQLLKARHVLKCSYVYGYYLEETGYRKPIFEFMQTELEECTETLSEMVARPYLRTPRNKIVQTAHLVQRKRHEFVTAIAKGLVPPDTSPGSRKRRKMFSVKIDEDTKKALIASLQDDPTTLWVKDSSGRHTNVSALLDWPEESDESDSETTSPSKFPTAMSSLATTGGDVEANPSQVDIEIPDLAEAGKCARENCFHLCARNPRTGELHQHCSMRCMRMDKLEKENGEDPSASKSTTDFFADYHMELLRALEMSRMQYIKEIGSLYPGDRSCRSPGLSPRLSPSLSHVGMSSRHPSTSSDVIELQQQSIFLADPPLGRNAPPPPQVPDPVGTSESSQNISRSDEAFIGLFDPELEHALEMSRLSMQEEERQLCLAIELSMKDSSTAGTSTGPSLLKPTSQVSMVDPARSITQSRSCETLPRRIASSKSDAFTTHKNAIFDPTVVQSDITAPVWSTHTLQNGVVVNQNIPEPPICAKVRNTSASMADDTDNMSAARSFRLASHNRSSKTNSFGVIKDITVANILPTDHDKTKEFINKDFSQLFCKPADVSGDAPEIEYVFEPRPPHPSHSPLLSREKCIFTQNETVSMVDPWQQRTSVLDYCHGKPTRPQYGTLQHHHRDLTYGCQCSHFGNSTFCGFADDSAEKKTSRRKSTQGLEYVGCSDAIKESSVCALPPPRPIDPVDMVISSEILESLLQGAEGYASNRRSGKSYESLDKEENVVEAEAVSSDEISGTFLSESLPAAQNVAEETAAGSHCDDEEPVAVSTDLDEGAVYV